MIVTEEPRQATTDLPDASPLTAEALIKEARRHRRRRHLAYVAVTILVIAGVVVAVFANRRPAHNLAAASNEPKVAGPPMGRVVSLKLAGPLAVGPNGALYVVDEQRHEVLVRLADGQFRVVAGDGKDGFSGDGGPATKAALSNVSDITFGPEGDLYMADGGRVRVVNGAGTIRTIAGNGTFVSVADGTNSGSVANGTPALSASLASLSSIALGRTGELYLATFSQLLRLTPAGKLVTVRAVIPSGLSRGSSFPATMPISLSMLMETSTSAQALRAGRSTGSLPTEWRLISDTPGVAEEVRRCLRSGLAESSRQTTA